MKIAVFDIDDTVTYETEFMRKYAPDFIKKKYHIDVNKYENPYGYNVMETYGLVNLLMINGYSLEEATLKGKKIEQDFWNSHFVKYCGTKVREDIKQKLLQLYDDDYKIYFVSLRGKKTKQDEKFLDRLIRRGIVPLLTRYQLKKNGIRYEKLKLVSSEQMKLDYITSLNPTYIFEDNKNIIQNLSAKGLSSKIICVQNVHNSNLSLPTGVVFHHDFQINENLVISKQKKVYKENKFVRWKSRFIYRLIRMIGFPLVMAKFKPIISGKENIPKDGSVSFVGNHRTKNDPIVMMAATSHIIRWAALKRLFVGGEDLFSNTKNSFRRNVSSEILKLMEAQPIAREDDENYIGTNLKSMKYFSKSLQSGKESIGFFPEGTLNREIKEPILPLKSDYIFKFTAKEDRFIQPFSIVWISPNIGLKNKVLVRFGYPIHCSKENASCLQTIWTDSVQSAILESDQLLEEIASIYQNQELNSKKKVKTLIRNFKEY